MSEAEEKKLDMTEEITIDLSRIPLRPTGKREIQQLEMALIIATLYSPEVLELIRDPVERATWVDSLAVAAAALARQKAGYTISQIAEEVGRSETMIRAHLNGKTKAGKLVIQTYEKLKKGELKIVVPFIKVPKEMAMKIQDLEKIRKDLEEKLRQYEEKARELEKQLKQYQEENNMLKQKITELEEKIKTLEEEKRRLEEKTSSYEELINKIKEKISVLEEIKELIEKI